MNPSVGCVARAGKHALRTKERPIRVYRRNSNKTSREVFGREKSLYFRLTGEQVQYFLHP
jgi:hypothetical protein